MWLHAIGYPYIESSNEPGRRVCIANVAIYLGERQRFCCKNKATSNLILGNKINHDIDEYIVFQDLDTDQNALWSLMLMSGYLKAENIKSEGISRNVDLSIPNYEVLIFYKHIIKRWLSKGRDSKWYDDFINNLITGNIKEFATDLQDLVSGTFSFHDTDKKNGEKIYHGLMLGLVASLRDRYDVKSN